MGTYSFLDGKNSSSGKLKYYQVSQNMKIKIMEQL